MLLDLIRDECVKKFEITHDEFYLKTKRQEIFLSRCMFVNIATYYGYTHKMIADYMSKTGKFSMGFVKWTINRHSEIYGSIKFYTKYYDDVKSIRFEELG